MKPRERVLKAINHEEPDRLPIDFGGENTGISGEAYKNLVEYLGLDEEIYVYSPLWDIAEVSQEVRDLFGVDVVYAHRTLPPSALHEESEWEEWKLNDGRGCLIPKEWAKRIETDDEGNEYIRTKGGELMLKRSVNSPYFDDYPVHYHPLEDVDDWKAIEELPEGPLMAEFSESDFRRLEKNAKWLRENTDYAIVALFGGSMFENPTHLRGYEQFLRDVKKNPDFIIWLEEMLVEKYKKLLDGFLPAVAEYVDIIQFNDDLGHQSAPLISPKDYERLIHPYMKEVYQYVKKNSDCYIMRHSCGAIEPFIEYFIDMGVDILNPVQISAKGMDPKKLKEKYGDEITFWGGGVDTQNVLPKAPPMKVKEHVKEIIDIFAPGGGFVFTQVHNIQPEVPPENIVTAYKTAKEARPYK